MKMILLTVLLKITVLSLHAQNLDKAIDLLRGNMLANARQEIDEYIAIEKNTRNPKAWYFRSKIYAAIGKDTTMEQSVPGALEQAITFIMKYFELEDLQQPDPDKRYFYSTLDNHAVPYDVYYIYNVRGAKAYNTGDFNKALINYQKTLKTFDWIVSKKLTRSSFDTSITLYAGMSAEKAGKTGEAAIYYGQIAARKITGEGYNEIYKWLTDYYQQKGDMATAVKFAGLGKEVYPQEPFWAAFDIDMLRQKGTKADVYKKYEEQIIKNPDEHLFLYNYAVELYEEAYTTDLSKRPANSQEQIGKATELLRRCIGKKPDFVDAHMVMGQILYNQGVDAHQQFKALLPKDGAELSAGQLQRKEILYRQAMEKFDEAMPYLMQTAELLDKQGKLNTNNKEMLKNSLNLLLTIYEEKETRLKSNSGTSQDIKTIGEQIAAYTAKYDTVDSRH